VFSDDDIRLYQALSDDPRQSAARLAERTGLSPTTVQDIAGFEARLAVQVPELTITDRAVALWVLKLGGHLLDPHGRNLRSVPLGFWSDPVSDAAEYDLLARLRHPVRGERRPAGGRC
jgi:hypothetical protein